MSPPPLFAFVLVGAWAIMIFAVTNQTGYAQLLADERDWSTDFEADDETTVANVRPPSDD